MDKKASKRKLELDGDALFEQVLRICYDLFDFLHALLCFYWLSTYVHVIYFLYLDSLRHTQEHVSPNNAPYSRLRRKILMKHKYSVNNATTSNAISSSQLNGRERSKRVKTSKDKRSFAG